MTTKDNNQDSKKSCNAKSGADHKTDHSQWSDAMRTLLPFMPKRQLLAVAMSRRQARGGAPGVAGDDQYFLRKFVSLAALIDGMPKTYDQDGKGDAAVVTLHYFLGGSDWYILEKDKDVYQGQAFGFACTNGLTNCAEMGYLSIAEITRRGAELDINFTPCPLGEVKKKHAPYLFFA